MGNTNTNMNYPSLLYLTEPETAPIDATVFEDVKLIHLVGGDVLDAMKYPLNAENITARQELFREMEDPSFSEWLHRLYDAIEDVARYDARMNSAASEIERKCAFVGLLRAYTAFCREACAREGQGALSSRFTAFFKAEIRKPYFLRAEEETGEVWPRIGELSKSLFCVSGETLRVTVNPPEAFVTRIARCASELGLPEIPPAKISARPLSPAIVEKTAALYPDAVNAILAFCEKNRNFYVADVLEYRSALAFYLRMEQIFARVRRAGIPLCYPTIAPERIVEVRDAYDITLMTKDEMKIIPNDISFHAEEPFFYLTGANGGGKTTYLRAVAVTLLLFMSGCPIAAESASIYPPDSLFTHFPRDERFDRIGRFEDEERRVNDILDRMSSNSVVLLNETYSTTSEESAVELTNKLADRLYDAGVYGIYITHQHGLGETRIPYLNVVVDRDDANRRTYKVAKRKNEQGSLALDVLRRYRLTAEDLAERFGSARPEEQKEEGSR